MKLTVSEATIELSVIQIDGGTQTRAGISYETVEEYTEAYRSGSTFPDIVVYYDGTKYWLADGFHRVAAAKKAGLSEINADIKQGTRREAVLHSVGANSTHGLRRTNADKRRAVMTLLQDEEWSKWSDREIARRCAVSNRFVTSLRNELSVNDTQIKRERKVNRGGTTYTQNTQNIGQKQRKEQKKDMWEEESPYQEEATNDYYESVYNEESFQEYLKQFNPENMIDFQIEIQKREIALFMRTIEDENVKHYAVNELLKYLRTLSIEYNRESVKIAQ